MNCIFCEDMSLYVGNLHPDCNDAILFKKFSEVGKILSVKVCRDSTTANSLGHGYVNFSKEEDAKEAMDTMNYDMLCGRCVRIMWAQKNPSNLPQSANLVVKNLDSNTNELTLKEIFSLFGEILSIKVARNVRGDSKGYGFIQFAEEEAANTAVSSLKNEEIRGRKLSISKYIPTEERRRFQQIQFPNNIYICNLTTTSSEELEKMCEAFGDVVSAKVITDDNNRSKGFGFVSFKEKQCAEKALQELNRLCLNGKRIVATSVNKNKVVKVQQF